MFPTYWGYLEEIAHQSCFSVFLHIENRQDKSSARGLFLAGNVWPSLLLLLFHDPPDKAEEQAGAFPGVPVFPLDDMLYASVSLCLGVFPCQRCRTDVCCHCGHYSQDAFQPFPLSPGLSGKRTAGKWLPCPDSRCLLSVNGSFRCKHSAVGSACAQFWDALNLHHA